MRALNNEKVLNLFAHAPIVSSVFICLARALYVRNPYHILVSGLVEGEIVKVTTKGQITLPARIRRSLNIRDDSHLYVAQAGDIVVMKRVDELTLSDITGILERLAEEKGVTGEILRAEAEEQRRRTAAEKNLEA